MLIFAKRMWVVAKLPAVAVSAALLAGGAASATCSPLPHTLSNGSTADATQVMADFNGILSCPQFSGPIAYGTTTPAGGLNIHGSPTYLENDSTIGDQLYIRGATNLNQELIIGYNTSTNVSEISSILSGTSPEPLALNPVGGNVGVDTASPAALLSLGSTITTIKLAAWDGGSSNLYGIGVNSGELTFGAGISASGTPQMVLTSSGDIGIGVASPTVAIDVAGAGHATLGWSTTSDARLKKDVVEIGDALDLVEHLEGVRFQWRSPSERAVGQTLSLPQGQEQIGLIAQEVEAVLPEVVTKPSDPAGTYALRYDALVPVLIEAIKEQQREIDELKAQIGRTTPASVASR